MALNTRTYSDIDVSFIPNPITGDLVKKTNVEAVVQALQNLVQLSYYEKPFHPEIGGNVRRLLFEPLDNITANLLSNELKTIIKNFEERVNVIGVYVDTNSTEDGYTVTIEFYIVSLADPITISFFLQRIR